MSARQYSFKVGYRSKVRVGKAHELAGRDQCHAEQPWTILVSYLNRGDISLPGTPGDVQIAPVFVRATMKNGDGAPAVFERSVPLVGACLKLAGDVDIELFQPRLEDAGALSEATYELSVVVIPMHVPDQYVPASYNAPTTTNVPLLPIPDFASIILGERNETSQISIFAPDGQAVRAIPSRDLIAVPDWGTHFGTPSTFGGTFFLVRCFG